MILISEDTKSLSIKPFAGANHEPRPIWKDILLLTKEPSQTDFLLSRCKEVLDEGSLKRMEQWLNFLEDQYVSILPFYNGLVHSILLEFMDDGFIRNQTPYEFDLSKNVLLTTFGIAPGLRPGDKFVAGQLLRLSLIAGNYPGMRLVSWRKAFAHIDQSLSLEHLRQSFKLLYVRYEIPSALLNMVLEMDQTEIAAMMHVFQGKNIRRFEALPLSVSRKESFYFMNLGPVGITYQDNFLLRHILWSKLCKVKPKQQRYLELMLLNCRTWEMNLKRFTQDIKFWCQLFDILTRDPESIALHDRMDEYLDYVEFQRYVSGEGFSLNGRTPDSICRLSCQWHSSFLSIAEPDPNLVWSEGEEEDMKIEFKGRSYVFRLIKSSEEIHEESREMRHCAFSYEPECEAGIVQLWSVRLVEDNKETRCLTLETRYDEIAQAKGYQNRTVREEEGELIKLWLGKKLSS